MRKKTHCLHCKPGAQNNQMCYRHTTEIRTKNHIIDNEGSQSGVHSPRKVAAQLQASQLLDYRL